MKKLALYSFAACAMAFGLAGCLKKDYDLPADGSTYDPALTVTHSIKSLLDMNGSYNNTAKDDTVAFTQDWVISGVVTANDRSGNFYKAIVIQDSSAAIQLLIDDYSLYADYPVGRKVYVKLKGLFLGYYSGTPVLGGSVTAQRGIDGVAGNMIGKAIVGGPVGQSIMADTVTLAEIKTLKTPYLNRLVYIRDAQFAEPTLTYSDPLASTSLDVVDCDANKIVLRTSNYADFAGVTVPEGRGPLMGIYTVYISSSGYTTPQLVIRDRTDVAMMTGARCGAPAGSLFAETFDATSSNTNIVLPGWNNVAEGGNVLWKGASYNGAKYAQIQGYGTGATSIRTWLVSPAITNLSSVASPVLNFKTKDGYDNGATLKVYASTDYNGGSTPWLYTWTQLPASVSAGHSSGYASDWTASGDVSLNAYKANPNVYLAFVYEGTDPSGTSSDKTTTYQLEDVIVK